MLKLKIYRNKYSFIHSYYVVLGWLVIGLLVSLMAIGTQQQNKNKSSKKVLFFFLNGPAFTPLPLS